MNIFVLQIPVNIVSLKEPLNMKRLLTLVIFLGLIWSDSNSQTI